MGNRLSSTDEGKEGEEEEGNRGTKAEAPLRILCYGDSLTAGYTLDLRPLTDPGEIPTRVFAPWAPLLQEALRAEFGDGMVEVDHVGMNGWTTFQMLNYADEKQNEDVCGEHHAGLRRLLKKRRPAYTHVLLMAGTNDLGTADAASIVGNTIKLHDIASSAGAETFALAIPESRSCKQIGWVGEKRTTCNALLREWSEDAPSTHFLAVDLDVPFSENSGDWEDDGLHMTKQGYARLAAALSGHLKGLIPPQ